ncbi:serine hydroxymethyltransferase [Vibrio chagasii]|uniref:serine hydroxymethyltransferase n=1 Tax=Vibrio chagasii TaxID=170679 RepID=UPI0038CF1F32
MIINKQMHDMNILNDATALLGCSTSKDLYQKLRALIEQHDTVRVKTGINLVAAEGPMSLQARQLLSCDLGSRASGGSIGRNNRFFTGLDQADEIEALCIVLLKELFECNHADPRLLGGLHANTVVYAVLKNHFKVSDMSTLNTFYGGNSSNHSLGPPGVLNYSISDLPVDPNTLEIDLNAFEYMAKCRQPKLVSLGAGLNLFPFPVKEIKDIISRWGGMLLFDGSHQAGLIAAGVYPNPLSLGADIYTASTGKTFSGPQGGVICWNSEKFSSPVSTTIFPKLTGSHQLNRIAALTVSCLELKEYGLEYMAQGILNARQLASNLQAHGLDVLCSDEGFTETHQVVVKWTQEEGARLACYRLADVRVFANAVPLPEDRGLLSGIRFGATEITRLGITQSQIFILAEVIAGVLQGNYNLKEARNVVGELSSTLSDFKYCLEGGQ